MGSPATSPTRRRSGQWPTSWGLSAFHLCRVFRRHAGTTIHRYLTRVRLRAALARLEGGSPDLAMLALELGFFHQSHFTEAFRREYGSPPGALRRRLRRSSGPIWP
ncbi:MAG: helix-turn-helix transcriptional regulator [Actinobacteria bacterium]|nr:helix-turn-helix transcriptional regulator [Actinomycetota bacterium]